MSRTHGRRLSASCITRGAARDFEGLPVLPVFTAIYIKSFHVDLI
jgi:hypothetical protein